MLPKFEPLGQPISLPKPVRSAHEHAQESWVGKDLYDRFLPNNRYYLIASTCDSLRFWVEPPIRLGSPMLVAMMLKDYYAPQI